jgi:hypothetical protein
MQFDKSSSSTTAASFSLSLSHNGRVCHRSFFLFFLVYLPVWLLLCYYTKDVVCLSIKDINLLIRETGQTTMMYVYANARRWEGAEKGGTMTRQQRTVLFKCENLKMRVVMQTREREELCARLFLVCVWVCCHSFSLFTPAWHKRYVHGKLLLLIMTCMLMMLLKNR